MIKPSYSSLGCSCLVPQYSGEAWGELSLHVEEQDTSCDAWKRLLELVERVADNEAEVFDPRGELEDVWHKIITLPPSIARMKSVKQMLIWGSNLVRIPPEIGQMTELAEIEVYMSYQLHWLPYEIMQCKNLKETSISIRALYGNHNYRPPFPRLRSHIDLLTPEVCSLCHGAFRISGPVTTWITLHPAPADIVPDPIPLLVHACSQNCIDDLPSGPQDYLARSHKGGLSLVQPPTRFDR